MTMTETANSAFRQGVGCFKSAQFSEALSHFDKVSLIFTDVCTGGDLFILDFQLAMAQGATGHIVFESRSAALEKLGRISEALKDARKVIELVPLSPQVPLLYLMNGAL